MDYRKIARTALLAGEMMITSGAEIYRVEDTMNHILDSAKPATHTVFALSTGITLTIWSDEGEFTVSTRIPGRSTNLNCIDLVNNISRKLARKEIDIGEAYDILCDIRYKTQYSPLLKFMCYIGVCFGFTLLLGGSYIDSTVSAMVGFVLSVIYFACLYFKANSFCINLICAYFVVLVARILSIFIFKDINSELVIIGAIMPLVPGVIFTTAMRDTLHGDYISGMGRILEAIVVASAIAAGAGAATWTINFLVLA